MSIDNRLYGSVGLGVNVRDEADSTVSDFIGSTSVLRAETGIVQLFIPTTERNTEERRTQPVTSVTNVTEVPGEIVEENNPSARIESPSVLLRRNEVQQQILNNAIEVADDLDIDDDLDIADSFEASFGDLSGFAAAEGFFDNTIDDSFDFGEDERASTINYADSDDLTGVNSLVIDNLTNANNPFMAIQGINRLGFITEDLKQIQNDRLLGRV